MTWRAISRVRAFYIVVAFALATFLFLIHATQPLSALYLTTLHAVILLAVIIATNIISDKRIELLSKPFYLKLFNAIAYASIPLIINIPALERAKLLDGFFIYLLGLIAAFGAVNGFQLNCEVNAPDQAPNRLRMVREERLQQVWPFVFFFVLTLIASPFVAASLGLDRVKNPTTLMLLILIAMIGFHTLLALPVKNLQDLREAIIESEEKSRS